jgi:hypothetical protein
MVEVLVTHPNSYMAKVEGVLAEWEAHGIDAAQARKRFREIVGEWLASPKEEWTSVVERSTPARTK